MAKLIIFATLLIILYNCNLGGAENSANNDPNPGFNFDLSSAGHLLISAIRYAFLPEISSVGTNNVLPQIRPPTTTTHQTLRYNGTTHLRNIMNDNFYGGFGIQSKKSRKCADIYQGSSSDGIKLEIWECNDGDNQKFSLGFTGLTNVVGPILPGALCFGGPCQKSPRPLFQIVGKLSKKCLDVANLGTGDNTDVIQYDCQTPPRENQLWTTWVSDIFPWCRKTVKNASRFLKGKMSTEKSSTFIPAANRTINFGAFINFNSLISV
ncbi:Endo-1,4-beta-xylanase A [Folsomia candida]|uniref:Endo-1,4-beta-xylanase A n=1 Tax=Folsomia candida TaxID=158441 RepID=A0A226D5R0_FOLCA|nr:Endo-1,4-beta-xylanase A [Folsomia candida]